MAYKILYIEDEKILGKLVCDSLAKEGYDVLQIHNGAEAITAFREYKPHLCLLDIMLPGRDGYQIAAQMRNMDKKIPIIFLTAKVQVTDLVQGFKAGCNDYIRKPFSIDELNLRISNWISEKYGEQDIAEGDYYQIDEYGFYPQKHLLTTPEGNIDLTYKETLLLLLLYSHKNNVVSRDFLMQKIWGNAQSTRTLDVYINRLRKYFRNGEHRIITLKGVGYRFICTE